MREDKNTDKPTIRIDRFFGFASLVSILVFVVMVYMDASGITAGSSKEDSNNTSGTTATAKVTESTAQTSTAVAYTFEKSSGNLTVCIDPARGGQDTGVKSGTYDEKTLTLEMALQLKTYLEAANIHVILTRDSDTDIAEEKRTVTCNSSGANLCISLRVNAYSQDSSAQGAESYVYSGNNTEATKAATCILKNMTDTAGIKNRGVKKGTSISTSDDYYINAHCKCTSMVLEMGFITNKNDLAAMTTSKEKTAKAITDGIIEYFKQAGVF